MQVLVDSVSFSIEGEMNALTEFCIAFHSVSLDMDSFPVW